MKVIGLTGGIGSGKSTVSMFLAELGAVIIDADKIGHQVLDTDSEVWKQIVAAFGKKVLTPDGQIDRKKLGGLVFKESKALSRLNRIMHPRIYDVIKAQLEQHRKQGADVVVVEAPLLIEAGWVTMVDEVWVTVAPLATVLERLEQAGMSGTEAMARINSQLPAEERSKHPNVVIDTDCSLDELKVKVSKLWQKI
jgi:dephospho-CoA kinase